MKTLVVSYRGYLLLKQHFLGSDTTGNHSETVASNDENSIIDFLHGQLQEKDTQIKQMQKYSTSNNSSPYRQINRSKNCKNSYN